VDVAKFDSKKIMIEGCEGFKNSVIMMHILRMIHITPYSVCVCVCVFPGARQVFLLKAQRRACWFADTVSTATET